MKDLMIQFLKDTVAPGVSYEVAKGGIRLFWKRLTKGRKEKIPVSSEVQPSPIKIPERTRLQISLALINSSRHLSDHINLADVAEACGVESEMIVRGYFEDQTDSTPLAFMKAYSIAYNVNSKWLINKRDEPFSHFPVMFHEVHESAHFISEFRPKAMYLVKSKTEEAPFCIVLKRDDAYSVIHKHGNWKISDKTGATGQGQTASLYVLLKWLDRDSFVTWSSGQKTSNYFGLSCVRYGIELETDEEFWDLISGRVHPAILDTHLRKKCTSYWWDDFMDLDNKVFTQEKYASAYGKEFIRAKEVVRYVLEGRSFYSLALSEG